MANIIKFEKKSLRDMFLQSLSQTQTEMFFKLLMELDSKYEKLEQQYVKKSVECEMLKLENSVLRGEFGSENK